MAVHPSHQLDDDGMMIPLPERIYYNAFPGLFHYFIFFPTAAYIDESAAYPLCSSTIHHLKLLSLATWSFESRFPTAEAVFLLYYLVTMVTTVNGFKLTELSPGFGVEICDFNAADNMTEESFRRLQDTITMVLD